MPAHFLWLLLLPLRMMLLARGASTLIDEERSLARSRSPDNLDFGSGSRLETQTSGRSLGIAHDVVSIGDNGVAWGFGIARFATNAGFGIASACIRAPAAALEQTVGTNPLSSGLRGVDSVVDFAHKATRVGQDVAQTITHASLGITKAGLKAAGAQDGELLRMAVGYEAADAVVAVDAIVRRFAGPISGIPVPDLLSAARAWSAMQQASLAGRTYSSERVLLPQHAERWMRFTAATFGAAWFAGLVEGFSISAAARARAADAQGGGPGDAALAAAGIDASDVEVLAFEQQPREFFAPGYMVAVDHHVGAVVVALRGTSSVADVLADLVCEASPVQLGGMDGMAHDGMLRAAQRLEATLATLAESGLARLGPGIRPQIVICGHSLGAGVAALIAAVWRNLGRFPGVDVRCVAFACPQVLDADLALAMSNHTTSVVLGADLVPRLSLATVQDMHSAMLHLSNPSAHGLPQSLSVEEVLAAEARGDTQFLATAHATLWPAVRTPTGRLFPAGQIIYLRASGQSPLSVGPEDMDELLITSDMASAHMPRRYLLAVQEAHALH